MYIGTDPVEHEVDIHHGVRETIEYLEPHVAFFTWGENYGNRDCGVPVSDRFHFKPTRQPVVLDFWEAVSCRRRRNVHDDRQLASAVAGSDAQRRGVPLEQTFSSP